MPWTCFVFRLQADDIREDKKLVWCVLSIHLPRPCSAQVYLGRGFANAWKLQYRHLVRSAALEHVKERIPAGWVNLRKVSSSGPVTRSAFDDHTLTMRVEYSPSFTGRATDRVFPWQRGLEHELSPCTPDMQHRVSTNAGGASNWQSYTVVLRMKELSWNLHFLCCFARRRKSLQKLCWRFFGCKSGGFSPIE